ncbi:MAG: diguanylate cyclase [Pseudomonadota bacterium]
MSPSETPTGKHTGLNEQTALLREFGEEAREHLDHIEPDLLALEKDPASLEKDVINRIFRAIHSIKGSAALVGLAALRDFSHLVENVLLRVRAGELAPTPERIDVLLGAVDRLRQLIEAGPSGGAVDLERERRGLLAMQGGQVRKTPLPSPGLCPPAEEPVWPAQEEPGPQDLTMGRSVLVVEDNKVAARLLCEKIAAETNFTPVVAYCLAEARQALDEDRARFFVSVLDLNLPDAPDGEVVDLAIDQRLPAIILTATFDEAVRERILAKRVVDYVVKGGLKDLDYVAHLLNRLESNQWVKVLVVEDTRGIRENLKMLLQLHRYQVVTAEDGEQALGLMEEHPDVRVVITDYNMPRMDGLELVSRLRDRHSKDRLAIIGMSAEGTGTLSAKFLKSGANDFLPKPFLNEEFHCRVSQNVELLDLIKKIKEASYRDFLTDLFNRRYFFAAGQERHGRAVAGRRGLALGMIDIDHFKKVNDQHGHAVGDQALRHIASFLGGMFKEPALVARLGGEEFCVLVPDLDRQQALLRFNEVRKALERSPFNAGGPSIGLTVSIGLAMVPGPSLDDMLRRADDLLYQAKAKGRNRLVMES